MSKKQDEYLERTTARLRSLPSVRKGDRKASEVRAMLNNANRKEPYRGKD